MPAKLYSVTRQGINAQTIEIEVDVANGLHSFSIVGLPDKAVEESKERISSALKNNGFKAPRSFNKRVVINLAPADIKKEGGVYDVPMALGFLIDSQQIKPKIDLADTIVVGELGLDGNIRPIKGAILYAMHAKEAGYTNIIVPKENGTEAALVKGIDIVAPQNVKELVQHIEGRKDLQPVKTPTGKNRSKSKGGLFEDDFAYIKGQESAKKALEIAVAGGHNILFQGPPGTGKTMLARAAITIMPKMTYDESLEVTKIESVCRQLGDNPLITKRPFRAPHHSSSESAVIGGGSKLQPGEITRAHRGILFLDEFPELHRNVLESMRQPLEEGSILVARAKGSVEYPAKFMLVAAANPCPCGYFGDNYRACSCTTGSIVRYQKKLSGPIADRIDLHVSVPRQKYKKISSEELAESSSEVAGRVDKARSIQLERFKDEDILVNSEMKLKHIKKYCKLEDKLDKMLGKAVEKYKLSARGYHSTLKVARTVADLAGERDIKWEHLALALQYAKRENPEI